MADIKYKVGSAEFESGIISKDNGGRRIGFDRRNFSYSLHIPERRRLDDRRKAKNRRKTNRVEPK